MHVRTWPLLLKMTRDKISRRCVHPVIKMFPLYQDKAWKVGAIPNFSGHFAIYSILSHSLPAAPLSLRLSQAQHLRHWLRQLLVSQVHDFPWNRRGRGLTSWDPHQDILGNHKGPTHHQIYKQCSSISTALHSCTNASVTSRALKHQSYQGVLSGWEVSTFDIQYL